MGGGNTLNLYNGSLSVLDGGLVTTAGARSTLPV